MNFHSLVLEALDNKSVLSQFDIKIIQTSPIHNDKGLGTEVHFSVDGYPEGEPYYEYIYYPNDQKGSWFSDFPEEFSKPLATEPGFGVRIDNEFFNFIKNYLFNQKLSPETRETFGKEMNEL
jgi:hypothetical protein